MRRNLAFFAGIILCSTMILEAEEAKTGREQPQGKSAKLACDDRDKAVDRAARAYKQAVDEADKDYVRRLKKLYDSPQTPAIAGERKRLEDAVKAAEAEQWQAEYVNSTVTIEPEKFIQPPTPDLTLHKGMQKNDLLTAYPKKPEIDSTDSDGVERIVWEQKSLQHRPSSGVRNLSDGIDQTLVWKLDERTTVYLRNGVVTEFQVDDFK